MAAPITVLTPTGTLGYGFGAEALARGMSLQPDVIAVDAGSTDPGPHYLGAGEPLVSRLSMKRELTDLINASREARIPLIVGSAGGAGSRAHVDWTAEIVREIARETGRHFQARLDLCRHPARARQGSRCGPARSRTSKPGTLSPRRAWTRP